MDLNSLSARVLPDPADYRQIVVLADFHGKELTGIHPSLIPLLSSRNAPEMTQRGTLVCQLVSLGTAWLASASAVAAGVIFVPAEPGIWAFELGLASITSNNNTEILYGKINLYDGPEGGEVYKLTASRLLGILEWHVGGHVFRPSVELPLTLEVVDENARSPFPDYNASVMVRWVDFPWQDRVRVTLGMGLGLSYSSKIWAMDQKRHPGEDRSHLKFNWPIQMSLALPDRPEHQLLLLFVHQSGGHLFDQGGVNSLGLGYRFGF
jgi:hypothetical protein